MPKWHPDAKRVHYADAGPFLAGAGAKLCWHTTEGYGLPQYVGSAPHFTLSIKTGDLWQHVPIDVASSSLLHPRGTVETNHANVIQVELTDAFAKDSATWPKEAYAHIAKLARWIEVNADVPRECHVEFGAYPNALPPRLRPVPWIRYAGHCGHQHVPNNQHGDPGAFRIDLVLGDSGPEHRRQIWATHLARIRIDARKHGWTLARRIKARVLKRLLSR